MRVVKEDEMVEALVEEAERLVAEGVEARLAAKDPKAAAAAEQDRLALLDEKGADANQAQVKIDSIRRKTDR